MIMRITDNIQKISVRNNVEIHLSNSIILKMENTI